MRRVFGFYLLLALIGAPFAAAAEFYRWTDQKGVVHFTDSLHSVPEKYRNGATRIQGRESPRLPDAAKPASPVKASVPIEKHGQVVIVQAMLNGKASAKFVVDTGASFTMISSAMAKELAIDLDPNRRSMPFQTANGVIQAPLTSLESVTVGGMEIKNLTAAVHDALPDSTAAGLLGLNFLTHFRLDIDTEKGLLHLEKK